MNFARRGWGLVFTLLPAAILFSMLTFAVATEQSLSELRNAGTIGRTVRLGTVSGYPMATIGYTEAEIKQLEQLQGIKVGPLYSYACGPGKEHADDLQCEASNSTFIRTHDYTIHVNDAQLDAWDKVKNGAIITRYMAERYGWKVGDAITLVDTKDHTFSLVVSAIADAGLEGHSLYIHSEYFRDTTGSLRFWSVWLLAENQARRDTALKEVDANLNSIHRPHSIWRGEATLALLLSTSKTIVTSFQAAGAISFVLVICLSLTLLIVSLEQRRAELATMMALGFRRFTLSVAVVVEGELLLFSASLVGALVTALAFHGKPLQLDVVVSVVVTMQLVPIVALGGAVLGSLTALIPAWRTYKLDVLSALR